MDNCSVPSLERNLLPSIYDLLPSWMLDCGCGIDSKAGEIMPWDSCSQSIVFRHLGIPETFSVGLHIVKTLSIILLRCCLPYPLSHRSKMAVSLKNILDEAVIPMINVVKSRTISSWIKFHSMCEEMKSMHRIVLKQSTSATVELRTELVTFVFLMAHHFYLEKQLADKPWLFRLGHLADIFLKMNERSLLLQGKQLTVFVTRVKIQVLKKKWELEKLNLPLW